MAKAHKHKKQKGLITVSTQGGNPPIYNAAVVAIDKTITKHDLQKCVRSALCFAKTLRTVSSYVVINPP